MCEIFDEMKASGFVRGKVCVFEASGLCPNKERKVIDNTISEEVANKCEQLRSIRGLTPLVPITPITLLRS